MYLKELGDVEGKTLHMNSKERTTVVVNSHFFYLIATVLETQLNVKFRNYCM